MAQPDIAKLVERLHACDTPTVCNAMEVAQGKRGFDGFTWRSVEWGGDPDARIIASPALRRSQAMLHQTSHHKAFARGGWIISNP